MFSIYKVCIWAENLAISTQVNTIWQCVMVETVTYDISQCTN